MGLNCYSFQLESAPPDSLLARTRTVYPPADGVMVIMTAWTGVMSRNVVNTSGFLIYIPHETHCVLNYTFGRGNNKNEKISLHYRKPNVVQVTARNQNE